LALEISSPNQGYWTTYFFYNLLFYLLFYLEIHFKPVECQQGRFLKKSQNNQLVEQKKFGANLRENPTVLSVLGAVYWF
jgi:hypothetical protein